EIPRPDFHLEVGSGTHGQQTARVMERLEEVLIQLADKGRPVDRVVVVGDVNSTLGAALAAAKLQIPVAHVEAGLRSFDRTMPEEINRVLTDAISDLLFVSEPAGVDNLLREGKPKDQIHLVGNVMIDTLFQLLPRAKELKTLDRLGLVPKEFGVVTLHRPSNVDKPETLGPLMEVLIEVGQDLPMVFPVHPRTQKRLESFGLISGASGSNGRGLRLLPPLGYLEFLSLTSQAKVIVTDSGGLQEEATALGIPCLTARWNTERPITVEQGTSTLVGNDPKLLREKLCEVVEGRYKQGKCPELWDGKAAHRIAEILLRT
ncbi:MAG: UDP-N-acetylglucosamine 2-epimerase (non-hydrolyzing), partial [Thermoguttaceae bacterium]|nr:UDP-N-acetylglucosamine 2-epimerase (non-hydrolyzing) [Thermoguttaceae bacterium]